MDWRVTSLIKFFTTSTESFQFVHLFYHIYEKPFKNIWEWRCELEKAQVLLQGDHHVKAMARWASWLHTLCPLHKLLAGTASAEWCWVLGRKEDWGAIHGKPASLLTNLHPALCLYSSPSIVFLTKLFFIGNITTSIFIWLICFYISFWEVRMYVFFFKKITGWHSLIRLYVTSV